MGSWMNTAKKSHPISSSCWRLLSCSAQRATSGWTLNDGTGPSNSSDDCHRRHSPGTGLLHSSATLLAGPRDSLGKTTSAMEEFDAWFAWLKQSLERYDANINDMMLGFKNLRDKMWYKTAVITSASYEEAKNVAIALKLMGQQPKAGVAAPAPRPRTLPKPTGNNFLLKTEAQVLDLMAANPDVAGPNKLADEQADMTQRWLSQYGVENFCKGEERIHRVLLRG